MAPNRIPAQKSRYSPENIGNPLCVRMLYDRFAVAAAGAQSGKRFIMVSLCLSVLEPEAPRPTSNTRFWMSSTMTRVGLQSGFIRAVGITEDTMNYGCPQREAGELRSRSDTEGEPAIEPR